MAIEIDVHPHGIILLVSSERRSLVGKRLRSLIARDLILSYQGQFIVPAESAYLVAQEFTGDQATWSNKAWALVMNQRSMLARLGEARFEVAEALDHPQLALDGYALVDRLDPHQVEAVAAMTTPSLVGLALFDEQGLGKTIMALCAFDRLRELGQVRYLLVLAPKSVLASWLDDVRKLFKDRYAVSVASGVQRTRHMLLHSEFDILLCNYEAAVSMQNLLVTTIKGKPAKTMLVIDESYFIKNPDAKRSQAVAEIRRHCDRAIILCGTPAPNSPRDIIHQVNVAYAGFIGGNKTIPQADAEITPFATQLLDETIYLRRLKADVLHDIPEKQFLKVFLDLSPKQKALYEQAYHDLVLSVRSVDDQEFRRNLSNFMARRVALLQICSHPGAIDPLYDETPAKLTALDMLLHELIDAQNKKVVLWSYYRYSLQTISERYQRYGLVRIDGSVLGLGERREAIRRFQEEGEVKLFLGNAAAAGAGITLTAAHHAIYESFSNQAAHYMQSVDRLHRRGQKHEVTYHVLLARNTLEEREFDQIREKERMGRELLGDKYEEPITRQRFLAELEAVGI